MMIEDELFGIFKDQLYTKKDFEFTWGNKTYIIPAGFMFDGASIPRIFWSLIGYPLESEFRVAALIHDWCYRTRCVSFMDANKLFLRRLKSQGVSYWKRGLMYSSVVCGGYLTYRGTNKESLEQIKACLIENPRKNIVERQIKHPYYKLVA